MVVLVGGGARWGCAWAQKALCLCEHPTVQHGTEARGQQSTELRCMSASPRRRIYIGMRLWWPGRTHCPIRPPPFPDQLTPPALSNH
eukprot:10482-Eustigmatos_ZCMA.PRE.1